LLPLIASILLISATTIEHIFKCNVAIYIDMSEALTKSYVQL
jgi:hypothetical protein